MEDTDVDKVEEEPVPKNLEPKELDAKEAAEKKAADAARQLRSRLMGFSAMSMVVFGFLGFVPAYVVGFKDKIWYFDAIKPGNYDDSIEAEHEYGDTWYNMILVHSLTTMAWTAMAMFQIITGATGPPGTTRKKVHRVTGYIAVFLATLGTTLAIVLVFMRPITIKIGAIIVNVIMIAGNLGLAVYYARSKKYADHKTAMVWTMVWIYAPGTTRFMNYFLTLTSGCRFDSIAYNNIAWGILIALTVGPSFFILKEAKTKFFIVNWCLVIPGMLFDVMSLMGKSADNALCIKD